MPVKKITESDMLSAIICPAYIRYNYNPYALHLSQAIANKSLILFYQEIERFNFQYNLDDLIHACAIKASHKQLKNMSSSDKKRLRTYAINYILQFLQKYPPNIYYPILLDVNVPVTAASYEVDLNYNLILKNIKNKDLLIFDFIFSLDKQIKNNLNYFSAKKNLLLDRLSILIEKKLKYFCFYYPSLKNVNQYQSIDIAYCEIPSSNILINYYLNIFKDKISIKKNPFCCNFSCPKRKECTYDDSR
jgi:hypothetical protein